MASFIKYEKLFIALALITSLAACGDGGGTVATGPAVSTTIIGSAGDGPVKNGNVSVLGANGNAVITTPANPTTGPNAQFSFTVLSETTLPLIITVTGGTDTVTGAPQDFPLRTAVTSLPAGGTVTSNANPLSILIVASAEAQGGGTLTKANLVTATSNVLGAMGFGLATATNPLSTPANNTNIANIVRVNEAVAEMIRRASKASGNSPANTIASIAQDLTDGIVDGKVAAGATNTQVSNANASHILSQQAQVSAELLSNKLTVTTPAGVAIPGASGANFVSTMNNAITTTGYTGDVAADAPTQAFLNQTRNAINITNTLTGGGNAALNNLVGGINSLAAGTVPSTSQQTSLSGLTTAAVASFIAATGGANTPVTATTATNAAGAALLDTTAPVAPVMTAPVASVTGNNTPTVSGTAEANALVTVLNAGLSVGTAIATGGNWTLTSSLLADGTHTLTAKATDAAGNTGIASTSVNITVDTIAPTATLSTTATNPTNVSPVPVKVTFSEAVTGVALADFTVGNGAASNLVAVSATVYTIDVTPAGQGGVTVDVAANKAVDAAGNNNTAATQLSVTFDSVIPTATLSTTATNPTNVSPVPVKVTFSEAVTGVALADFTVGNGAASNLVAVSATVYTIDVTPAGQGVVTVDVSANKAVDVAGNNNTAAIQLSVTFDSVASSPVIATPSSGLFTAFSTPTVSGLAGSVEVNATVNVFDTDGTTLLGTTTAAGDGSWTLTSSTLATGSHTLTAKQTDAATNVSAGSTVTVTINNIPRFAYVANRGNNTVSMYTVDSTTGQLRHNGYVAAGTTPSYVASDPSGKFLYVANNGSNNVSTYTINQSTGLLASVGTVAAGTTPDFVTIDPTGRFAYVGNQNSSNVSQYTINQATGALIPSTPATVPAGTQPRRVTVDPSGRFVYVANLGDSTISAYTINQTTGVLTSIGAAILSGGTSPASVKVDPTGKFAYASNNFTDDVSAYTINQSTGALALIGTVATGGAGTGEISIDPLGSFLYIANGPANNVVTFSINPTTGALTSLGVIASAGTNTANNTVDPSGKFVYAVDDGTKSLSVFSINPANGTLTLDASITTQSAPRGIVVTGGITPVTYAPKFAYVVNQNSNDVSAYTVNVTTGVLTSIGIVTPAGTTPRGITIDPLNRFVYVVNRLSGDVSSFSIDQTTGNLTSSGAVVAAGTQPYTAVIESSGRFMYVVINTSNQVRSYSINQTSGALTSIGTIATGSSPDAIAVDPSGRFVYVANSVANTVSAYTINQSSGVLASLGVVVASGSNPNDVVVDPSGRFAYVLNFGSSTVSNYTIDQTTGALTLVGAIATGTGPRGLTVDPSGKFAYVANGLSNSVSAYTLNQSTGALTSVGSAVPAGTGAFDVAIDPSSKFAYVSNPNTNDISAYTINQTNGALTSIGATVAAGTAPIGMVFSNTFQ